MSWSLISIFHLDSMASSFITPQATFIGIRIRMNYILILIRIRVGGGNRFSFIIFPKILKFVPIFRRTFPNIFSISPAQIH